MKLRLAVAVAGAAFGAFAVAGPLQHIGVLPQTAVGDASKAMIKTALNMTSKPAFARCGPQGNNGIGNGGWDGVPGKGKQFEDVNR
ncbi:MAG TPA: hypothetical protein VEG60_21955 [Candidatus Binatia bacterium]|nr:hypothetical protein [Candidatus Binatia bacterium]